MNSWPLGVNVMVNFSITDKASDVSLRVSNFYIWKGALNTTVAMYLLRNRFDTVMKYEAQRFEKNYAESSTLGINVSHGHKSIRNYCKQHKTRCFITYIYTTRCRECFDKIQGV